jgi:hypothetical protein
MAKKIAPHEDASGFALRLLDVDRNSVREESMQIDVIKRGDEWVATLRTGKASPRDIGTAPSLAEAIALAQSKVQSGDLSGGAQARKPRRATRRYRGRRRRLPGAAERAGAAVALA